MSQPKFLLPNPEPRMEQHIFHGKQLACWVGEALIDDIKGWVDNPRVELEVKKYRNEHAGIAPDQDDILQIMLKESDFKIKILASDIRINDVRTPIILNSSGVLLDGNRRFFAVKYLLSQVKPFGEEFDRHKKVPVWVLDSSHTEEEERFVLVHENFYSGMKEPWPEMVLAQYIYSDLQAGLSSKNVAEKYNWTVTKVNETRKIMDLISQFQHFATTSEPDGLDLDELEAEKIAASNYQFFNEAQKSFLQPLNTNPEFKAQFFRWIHENKFKSFQQVRVAYEGWSDPDLRQELLSASPEAAANVQAEVNYRKTGKQNKKTPGQRIDEFLKYLRELRVQDFQGIGQQDVDALVEISQKIVAMTTALENQID